MRLLLLLLRRVGRRLGRHVAVLLVLLLLLLLLPLLLLLLLPLRRLRERSALPRMEIREEVRHQATRQIKGARGRSGEMPFRWISNFDGSLPRKVLGKTKLYPITRNPIVVIGGEHRR